MYNTLTAGKTEMLPFWWILPFWEGKREEGGQRCCAKTRFVLDCVGAQHRRNVYSACKGISPLLLGDWINAGITLLPGASRAQVQWRLRCLFPFFWQTTEWKIVAGWSLKSIKLLLPRSLISLSFFFFSRLAVSPPVTQSAVGFDTITGTNHFWYFKVILSTTSPSFIVSHLDLSAIYTSDSGHRWRSGHRGRRGGFLDPVMPHKLPSIERYHRGEREAGQAVRGHFSVLIHSVYPRSDTAQGQSAS